MATKTPKALPEGIKLDTLKEHARSLQKTVAAGGVEAHSRIEPYFRDLFSGPTSMRPKIRLHQAQLVVAREYGFASWRRLKDFVEARDAFHEALRNVAGIRDRMPKPSKALSEEMNAAQREMSRRRTRFEESSPAPPERDPDEMHCSFCHKSQYDVARLLVGPGVRICNECISVCNEVLGSYSEP